MSNLDRRTLVTAAAATGVMAAFAAMQSAQAAAPAGLFVIAEIVAKPDKADALRTLLLPFTEKSRTEPGCKQYTLLEVQNEPGRFLTFEIWTDKAALDGHMKTPHIAELVLKLGDLLAKPFTQIFMNGVSG